MRYLNLNLAWLVPATMAIAVIWLVSALANYYFGASLGTDTPFDALLFKTTTSEIFSRASLASDVLKCVSLFAFAAATATKQWRPAIVTGAIWLVCTAWSVASAVGFVAINHATVTDTRGQNATEWAQLQDQITRLEDRRKQVGAARPEPVVQSDLDALLRTPGLDGCASINGPVTKAVCPKIDGLRAELGNAKSAAWLDGRLDELRGEMKKSSRVTSENPFADLAGGVLGVAASKITTGQALWFALLLELISGPGLWGIWSAAAKPQEASGAPKASPAPIAVARIETPAGAPAIPVFDAIPPENPKAWASTSEIAKLRGLVAEMKAHGISPSEPEGGGTPIPSDPPAAAEVAEDETNVVQLADHDPRPTKREKKRIKREQQESRDRELSAIVERFADEQLITAGKGAALVKTKKRGYCAGGTKGTIVHAAFQSWCAEQGIEGMHNNHFGKLIKQFVDTAASARGIYYGCTVRAAEAQRRKVA